MLGRRSIWSCIMCMFLKHQKWQNEPMQLTESRHAFITTRKELTTKRVAVNIIAQKKYQDFEVIYQKKRLSLYSYINLDSCGQLYASF